MRFFYVLLFVLAVSCKPRKPKALYEILKGETFEVELTVFQNEPYYWEWANQENTKAVNLSLRVFQNQRLVHKLRGFGTETWTFEGIKTGTDTLRIYLRAYEEDTLNEPLIDSVIIAVTVN